MVPRGLAWANPGAPGPMPPRVCLLVGAAAALERDDLIRAKVAERLA
jgi:hypothetical protein